MKSLLDMNQQIVNTIITTENRQIQESQVIAHRQIVEQQQMQQYLAQTQLKGLKAQQQIIQAQQEQKKQLEQIQQIQTNTFTQIQQQLANNIALVQQQQQERDDLNKEKAKLLVENQTLLSHFVKQNEEIRALQEIVHQQQTITPNVSAVPHLLPIASNHHFSSSSSSSSSSASSILNSSFSQMLHNLSSPSSSVEHTPISTTITPPAANTSSSHGTIVSFNPSEMQNISHNPVTVSPTYDSPNTTSPYVIVDIVGDT